MNCSLFFKLLSLFALLSDASALRKTTSVLPPVKTLKQVDASSSFIGTPKDGSFVLLIPRGGDTKKEDAIKRVPLLLRPRFLFKFMAVGTATFGIPSLLFPKLMHPIFTSGSEYPSNTFYYYMFALRELYLASTFWLISTMPASTFPAWEVFTLFVLFSQTVMNIFHSGWNPMLQPVIIGTHGLFLVLLWIAYMKNIPPDEK